MKPLVTLILAAGLVLALPGASAAATTDTERANGPLPLAFIDGVVVRPVAAAFSVATTALYLGTSPLTYITGTSREAANLLVEWPWWFTSGRYIGRFGTYKEPGPVTDL